MAHRTMVMVKRTYLHIAVLTMLTAVLWLGLSIYQSLTTPSDISVDANIRNPITPSFDEEVFSAIISRENLNNLSFEPPNASASAVTINGVSPVESSGGNNTTDTPAVAPTENQDTTTQSTEVTAP